MGLPLYLRTTALAVGLAGLSLGGCTTTPAGQPRAVSSAADDVVPFTSMNAELLPDGGGYKVSWTAPNAGKVSVFSGTDAAPAAVGPSSGQVVLPGIKADPRPFFTLIPEHGAPLIVSDRSLHLASVPNWRDVGGYRTVDGQWVRMGKIFRADQLDKVSDADMVRIDDLNVKLVIDLRTNSERSREPDKIPPRASGLVLDVMGDSANAMGGDMQQAMAAIAAGKGVEMLTAANRDFVSSPNALKAYSAMMRELLDEKAGAVVYHCTAGKDRTGWATAVILGTLGVPRDTIMADYTLSNTYLKSKNEATAAMFKKSGAPFDIANLEPVMTVRPEYLQAAFDEMDKRYGSFDAYIRQGLGMTDADVAAFRNKYLLRP